MNWKWWGQGDSGWGSPESPRDVGLGGKVGSGSYSREGALLSASVHLSLISSLSQSFLLSFSLFLGIPGDASGEEPACQCRRCKRHRFDPWVGKIPWRTAWQPTPVFLPGESNGQRSLVGYSPWGHKESDQSNLAQHTFYLFSPPFPGSPSPKI